MEKELFLKKNQEIESILTEKIESERQNQEQTLKKNYDILFDQLSEKISYFENEFKQKELAIKNYESEIEFLRSQNLGLKSEIEQ